MSSTDSFIDEVNDEVRRTVSTLMLKDMAWIAILAVVLLVGGARGTKLQQGTEPERPRQKRLGDAILPRCPAENTAARRRPRSKTSKRTHPRAGVLSWGLPCKRQSRPKRARPTQAVATLNGIGTGRGCARDLTCEIAQFSAIPCKDRICRPMTPSGVGKIWRSGQQPAVARARAARR